MAAAEDKLDAALANRPGVRYDPAWAREMIVTGEGAARIGYRQAAVHRETANTLTAAADLAAANAQWWRDRLTTDGHRVPDVQPDLPLGAG